MTATISRSIPPQRLINLVNPLVRALLQSPLHGPLDSALLVLHITGRRTGRHYDLPVGYVDLDGHLVVVTQHSWRANLRGCSDMDVTYRGRRQRVHVDLEEDPTAVANTLHRVTTQRGWKAAQRLTGLKVHPDRTPTLPELVAAAHDFGLSTLTLTAARMPSPSNG